MDDDIKIDITYFNPPPNSGGGNGDGDQNKDSKGKPEESGGGNSDNGKDAENGEKANAKKDANAEGEGRNDIGSSDSQRPMNEDHLIKAVESIKIRLKTPKKRF